MNTYAGVCAALAGMVCATVAIAQVAPAGRPEAIAPSLPTAERDPLHIDWRTDPVLSLARVGAAPEAFRRMVRQAVETSAEAAEARAGVDEADAARKEATAGRYPTVDVGLEATHSLARHFDASDIDVLYERTRALRRIDATLNADQTLFDFGATESRIGAARARLDAAALDADAQATGVALRAIAAWYDVFAFRAMVGLGASLVADQGELRQAIDERIKLGVSAPGDVARVEGYIASAQADLARYRRAVANAEARFTELFGSAPPPDLGRAPILAPAEMSRASVVALADASPAVKSAAASARGAEAEARAQRAASKPRLAAGIDAGRYKLFDGDNYDIRARISLRQRLLGGVRARVQQYEARAAAATARADRVRREAEREAAIAWTDVDALQEQLAALESSYTASRQSRDVLAERFRTARGTLFDLLDADSAYYGVASSYVRGVIELDTARYALLSRTGKLLDALGVPATPAMRP